jgi:hypothetical protein
MRTGLPTSLTRLGTFLLAVTLSALLALPSPAITRTVPVSVPAPVQLKGETAVTGETACTGVLPFRLELRTGLFAANNPVNRIDPSGNADLTVVSVLTSAAIGATLGVINAEVATRGKATAGQLLGSALTGGLVGAVGGGIGSFFWEAGVGGRLFLLGVGTAGGLAGAGNALQQGDKTLATVLTIETAIGAAFFIAGDVYVTRLNRIPSYTTADVEAAITRLQAKGINPSKFQSHIDPENVIRIAELMKSGQFDPRLMDQPVIFETTSKSLLGGHHRTVAAEMVNFNLPKTEVSVPGTQPGSWPEVQRIPGRRQ